MTNKERASELLSSIHFIRGEIAIGIIIAHDDAIRRECAEKIEELKKHCVTKYPSSYEEGWLDAYNNAIASILGTEPARE